MIPSDHRDVQLQEIASRILGFDTLATRRLDRYDFVEVAVWQVREALAAAYDAGFAAAGGDRTADTNNTTNNGSMT